MREKTIGEERRLGEGITTLNGFNRAIVIAASLVLPSVGVIAGAYYMIRPERENDILGVVCFVLGLISLAIAYSISSFG